GDAARSEKVRRHFSDVEVALVHAGLLDRRDDAAHGHPDAARVLAVERVTRPDEDRLRAAAEGLGATHGRVDAEAAGGVVRWRDHTAAARVAADNERLQAKLRILELLDSGVERVEV